MAQQKDDTILEAQRSKLKPPPMFKVMLLNDDYTPMEFVVLVLQKFFSMTRERATQVMLKVHREGIGVCGVYPRDVATTKRAACRYYLEHVVPEAGGLAAAATAGAAIFYPDDGLFA